jgi:hypothetical protein
MKRKRAAGAVGQLRELRKALKANDADSVVTILRSYRAAHGAAWQRELLLSGIWPDPTPKPNLRESCGRLLAGYAGLVQVEDCALAELQEFLHTECAWLLAFSSLQLLQERLEELSVISDASATAERLLAFLESQALIVEKLIARKAGGGFLNLADGLRSTMSGPFGGLRSSPYAAMENNVESVELSIRYLLRRSDSFALPQTKPMISPYGDPELLRLLSYAAAWRQYQDLWANWKYGFLQLHSHDSRWLLIDHARRAWV